MKRWSSIFILFSCVIFLLTSVDFSKGEVLPANNATAVTEEARIAVKPPELPAVGSYENLKRLLQQARDQQDQLYGAIEKAKGSTLNNTVTAALDMGQRTGQSMAKAENTADLNQKTSGAGRDYSGTNVQVEGVDEADKVKTDGEYIYQVNRQRVAIIRAYPAENMELVGFVNFEDKNFNPSELYLTENLLVVIGSSYEDFTLYSSGVKANAIQPYTRSRKTKASVFDITDRKDVKKLREIELEGNYVSSRRIGSALYLVTNKYMNYSILEKEGSSPTPSYRDTAVQNDSINIGYDCIRYFPAMLESNYMIVAGFSLDRMDEGIQVSTYLGAGQQIYVSDKNMYVTVTANRRINKAKPQDLMEKNQGDTGVSADNLRHSPPDFERKTVIYKFGLSDGSSTYLANGEVPGTVLNQFSMDEQGSYFRIATTVGDVWRSDQYTSRNNVYILDDKLSFKGKLEDIAPGERIYSVRFMGSRAYMVTFKKVDPLFVLDLKDPANPSVLGALKIPGYSDYLHPYDENHILGFGKDTVEIPNKDSSGREIGTSAFYLGMKLALFDVSDVSHPIEKFSEKIGGRGTDSELLRNHKALLVSKEKSLLAFPVTLHEVKSNTNSVPGSGMPQYGQFTFQGAYVYNIDSEKGFSLKGRITHITPEEYLKSGNGGYYGDRSVERILYIGDSLFTLSKGMIKANELEDLKEMRAVSIP